MKARWEIIHDILEILKSNDLTYNGAESILSETMDYLGHTNINDYSLPEYEEQNCSDYY